MANRIIKRPVITDEEPQNRCLNCETTLQGEYCFRCGQKNTEIHISFLELTKNFIEDTFNIDSRLYKTTVAVFSQPGYFTLQYINGKRADYYNPVRLFIFTASFFFFVTFGPIFKEHTAATESMPRQESENSDTDKKFELVFDSIKEHKAEVLILVIPFIALLFKITYLNKGITYVDHIIFLLNLFSFYLFVSTILILIMYFFRPTTITDDFFSEHRSLLSLLCLAYLYASMKVAFQLSWLRTLWKLFLMFFIFIMSIIVLFFSVLFHYAT